jgi:hypothetical protein
VILTGPLVAVVVLVAPGAVLLTAGVRVLLRRRPDRLLGWLLAAVGVGMAALLLLLVGDYAPSWAAVLHGRAQASDVATVVAWSIILGLPWGPIWWRLDTAWRERQPMGGPTERRAREKVETRRHLWMVHTIQRAAFDPNRSAAVRRVASWRAVPDSTASGTLIGRKLAGDLDWPTAAGGALVMPGPPITQHFAVLGGTGSGKSELVWRKVEADLASGQPRQVISLNCKQPGHRGAPAERLEAVARQAGRSFVKLEPDVSPWDPMRGSTQRIHQRLMAAEEWSEPWYQHLGSVVLALALQLAVKQGHSTASLGDVVKQLLHGGLEQLAPTDPRAAEALKTIQMKDDGGLVTRLMDQAIQLGGWIGPVTVGGWSWEDADVIGVDLPTGTDPGTARMLLRLMLTDLEGWITEERRPMVGPRRAVPLTLVLEEISALDGDPILSQRVNNLMERARSSDVEVIVVAQGPSGLGDPRTQEAILTNATVVTGRQSTTEAVESLAGLAGTRIGEEASVAYAPGADVITGSIRAQHSFAVDPNRLRQLETGELVIIHRGRWALVAVAMSSAGYAYERGSDLPALLAQRTPDSLPSGLASDVDHEDQGDGDGDPFGPVGGGQ